MAKQNGGVIALRLDADHRRGMGHLSRMMMLADLFHDRNHRCFFVLRENAIAQKILEKASCEYAAFQTSRSEETIIEECLSVHIQPDLWIFDILDTDISWISQVHRYNVPVVCFDDQGGGPQAADLVINPIVGCWSDTEFRKTNETVLLQGPRYAVLDRSLTQYRKRSVVPGEPLKVGITLGGSDTHGATVKIAEILASMERLEAHFFLGPHFLHTEPLMTVLSRISFPYRIVPSAPDLHEELSAMDVVICGGGQTLFELATMGMPVGSLANEYHEQKTIAYFSRRGACIDLGNVHETIYAESLRRFFFYCVHLPKEIAAMSACAASLIDGKGAQRCYEACAALISADEHHPVFEQSYSEEQCL